MVCFHSINVEVNGVRLVNNYNLPDYATYGYKSNETSLWNRLDFILDFLVV